MKKLKIKHFFILYFLVALIFLGIYALYLYKNRPPGKFAGYEERVVPLTFEENSNDSNNSSLVYPEGMDVSDRYLGTDNISREVFFKYIDDEPGNEDRMILHIYANNPYSSFKEYCASEELKGTGHFQCSNEVQFGEERVGRTTWEKITNPGVTWDVVGSDVKYAMKKNGTIFVISVKGTSEKYDSAVKTLLKGFDFGN